ncbi:MAG: YkgJ family cysteine cluster protein [Planctomycetes bacterium]|nr:YkgJ family cysteine cluster protein [Planctomycetota bacterium]
MITTATPPSDLSFEQSKCGQCTALCCHYFALEIDAPEERADFENLRWYILHEDTELFIDGGAWFLQINRKCTWLAGNKCGRYEDRPAICAEYDNTECDLDGITAERHFRTIEELEAYREEWVVEREAKRSRRAAAARKSWSKRKKKAVRKASRAKEALSSAKGKARKKAVRKLETARKQTKKAVRKLAQLEA